MRYKRFAVATLVLAAGLMAAGCNPSNELVTIHYKQLGSCNGFNNGGGATSAGPNRAYATFRVANIENKDSAARDFNFDPNRIYIDQSSRAFTSTQLNLSQFNPFYAKARFVPKGTATAINGAVIGVVSTSAADGASEANKTSYTLFYDTPAGGQGVALVNDNPTQTTWPSTPDCTTIAF